MDKSNRESEMAISQTFIEYTDQNKISGFEEKDIRLTGVVGFQVNLLPENGVMKKLWLPSIAEGKYRFEDLEMECLKNDLYFEPVDGKWYIYCVNSLSFLDEFRHLSHSTQLSDRCFIEIIGEKKKYYIYVEEINYKNAVFNNYQVHAPASIKIGRTIEDGIVYRNKYISKNHAVLYFDSKNWYIEDVNSLNGVWINGEKKRSQKLVLGDTIYLLGLTIIIGVDFIAINDGIRDVEVISKKLKPIVERKSDDIKCIENKIFVEEFNRLPRRRLPFEPQKILIEGPPMPLGANQIPMILRMGSSMVMGGASALAGNYTMLMSSVLFPFLSQKYTDKEKKEYDARRVESYCRYLKDKRQEIRKEKKYEEEVLNQNYPCFSEIIKYPFEKTKLWERRKKDEDFLEIQIGRGRIPLIAEIEYPKERFSMDIDDLEEQMYKLAREEVYLDDAPILIDFIDNFVCSVSGLSKLAYEFMKRIIVTMTILHSYDELKTIFLINEKDLNEQLEFIKFLPHVWDDQKNIRFIATDIHQGYQIGEYLKKELGEDIYKTRELKDILKKRPYYLVFAFSKHIFDSMEVLKEILQCENSCGVSVITVFEDLPKECSLLFELHENNEHAVVHLKEITRDDDYFAFDLYDRKIVTESMRIMANTSLKSVSQSYGLPKHVSFLEMYKVGCIEHLNIAKRWIDNNPVKSLAVPIGVATDGSPFYLDLHQNYQGPHGLVAGTTGSGKSEFLITYILSLAVNFHPDEVAFVLIDYKGGDLATAFNNEEKGITLPHLIGTITNLDGASIQRSLISIQSELTRRQKIFQSVKKLAKGGTMDIYTYQQLYRDKIISEPMPHLFIISDEFAELKQQQPEFMDQLISAARIGRSLGVHLILATQKPAGVVNEQIRSNTKFRVCLKVQDRADSQDMLKRPEAAEIKETGRFYLQVGYNDYFALGQSAWSGAVYHAQNDVIIQRDDSVQVIDAIGQNLLEIKPTVEHDEGEGTQLVETIKAIMEIAKKQKVQPKKLWNPELAKKIEAKDLNDRTTVGTQIGCYLGVIDDSENQEQYNLYHDFEKASHMLIIGDALSGKTMLMHTILCTLTEKYTPEELNYYILDYSGRMLQEYKKFPHCGAVLMDEDSDSLDNFFSLLKSIENQRKKLYSDLGVDNFSSAKKLVKLPLILVLIDNLSGLGATKVGEQYFYDLHSWMKNSLNYGIRYIISCTHLNDISSKNRQEIGDCISFHMKDKYDYGNALNCRVMYTPPDLPGRGLYNMNGRPLEFHAAIYYASADESRWLDLMKDNLQRISKKYRGFSNAQRLPVLSEDATYEEFAGQFSKGRIPLGYSKQSKKAVAFPLKQFSTLSIYQGNAEGVETILKNFIFAAQKEQMQIWFLKSQNNSYYEKSNASDIDERISFIECEETVLERLWHDMSEEILKRKKIRTEYCDLKGYCEETEEDAGKIFEYMYQKTDPLVLMIENYSDFSQTVNMISAMVFDKLFRAVRGLNIYIWGFFYDNDLEAVKSKYIYSGFNSEENIILFGGRFNRQSLEELPGESNRMDKLIPYNTGIMKYRSSYHALLMPCGEIKNEQTDKDSQDIFT